MNWVIFLGMALLALVIVAAIDKQRTSERETSPYTRKPALFSPAERSFLGVLDQALGDDYRVFGKVRVADIIETKKGLENKVRQAAFNRINAKHFDFVLCNKDDLSVVGAIELDDKSHQQRKRKERDAFLVGLCEAASLPLMQMKAKRGYSVAELRTRVLGEIGLKMEPFFGENRAAENFIKGEPVFAGDEEVTPALQESAEPEMPECPKCGAPMVRRKAKTGRNVGEYFWGCSTFPKCRAISKN